MASWLNASIATSIKSANKVILPLLVMSLMMLSRFESEMESMRACLFVGAAAELARTKANAVISMKCIWPVDWGKRVYCRRIYMQEKVCFDEGLAC